ncbi:MAG: hypothetical protein N2690_05040 [Rhodocyclaceae bacterium]|nr:hypothetical protein [Rhodocyclaceae bacterium]
MKFNPFLVDTEPGSGGAFAPPAGFAGDYAECIRQRYRSDPAARQHIAIVARYVRLRRDVKFVGPFAAQAQELVRSFGAKNDRR